jgi:hypothetical protein
MRAPHPLRLIPRAKLHDTEVTLKRQWRVRRGMVGRTDARQRWDRAYQSVLRWSLEAEQRASDPNEDGKEEHHAGGGIRTGLDPGTGQAPDH